MNKYNIDVTGDDILSKNAGIIITYNDELVYAFKFSSDLQKDIRDFFKEGEYCFTNKKMLKPRVYCAIVSLIMKQIVEENHTETKEFHLYICRDFDGHEGDISNLLKGSLQRNIIFSNNSNANCSFVRHPKKSLIQKSALRIYNGNWKGINRVIPNIDDIHNLISKPDCRRKKWKR